jgi:radical SAM superfamily enzyme YgiQ (UPF0313 family)
MDVLLIAFPKADTIKKDKASIPVGLLYLNEYLGRHGIQSEILDLSVVGNHRVLRTMHASWILGKHPKLVCLNCFSSYQFPMVMDTAKKIKTALPSVKVCVGGSHPTFFAGEILKHCQYIDYVVIGEGETQVHELARVAMGIPIKQLYKIQSLCYRGQNGYICTTPRTIYLQDLDIDYKALWEPVDFCNYYADHSTWNNPKGHDIRLAVPILTSRACPFFCNFCSASNIMGRGLRPRSPENVLDEIEYLYNERKQSYFEFIDDNINVNRKHAMAIFSGIIKRDLDIQFSLASGIHMASADEELVRLMCDAGLAMIKLPIEHGNDDIRNRVIKKNLLKYQIFDIAAILKEYNVFTFGLFIMGFPEDTKNTLLDSYNLMKDLKLDIYETASLIPFPGTKIYEQCKRDNLFISDIPQRDLWKGVIRFDASEHDKFYIKPYKMTVEELQECRRKIEAIRLFSKRAREGCNADH